MTTVSAPPAAPATDPVKPGAPLQPVTPVLAIRDLAVHFAGRRGLFAPPAAVVRAVDGVDLTIAPGETLGLVGESGCGKSTLSNAVLGIVRPVRGSVQVAGAEVAAAPEGSAAGVWGLASSAAAGAALEPPRKSVTYQPEPLSWKPAAVSALDSAAAPQRGQSVSGASFTFCRAS
jgi:ABC-type dipeptide/oligopeptide/nickel transport system ATPase component